MAPTTDQNVLLIVKHYLPKTTAFDPYSKYPGFPAKILSSTMSPYISIHPSQIICHFAKWNLSNGECVVVNLSKVSTD